MNKLILGGASVVYVATAEMRDQEMADRIEYHQNQRRSEWTTIDESKEVAMKLTKLNSVVLLIV